MTTCDVCEQEMTAATGCTLTTLVVAGQRRKRLPHGAESLWIARLATKPCRDCGVAVGGVHHPGCCAEQCPVCAAQLFCCDCVKEEPSASAEKS